MFLSKVEFNLRKSRFSPYSPILRFLCLVDSFYRRHVSYVYNVHNMYPMQYIEYIQYILTTLIYFKHLPTSCKGGRIIVFVRFFWGGIPIYFKRLPTSWSHLLYPSDLYLFCMYVIICCYVLLYFPSLGLACGYVYSAQGQEEAAYRLWQSALPAGRDLLSYRS